MHVSIIPHVLVVRNERVDRLDNEVTLTHNTTGRQSIREHFARTFLPFFFVHTHPSFNTKGRIITIRPKEKKILELHHGMMSGKNMKEQSCQSSACG